MSNVDTASAPTTEKAKRDRVTNKDYLRRNGDAIEIVKDPRIADGIRIEVIGAGGPMDFFLDALPNDPEKNSRQGAAIFGLDVVLTNTIGGKRGDEAVENIMSRWETLESGEWSSRKGGEGPRISLLAEAVVAAFAKVGEEKDLTEVSAALKEKGEEGRKAVLENKVIFAEYKRLQYEAAKKRADDAAKAAAATEGGLEGFTI